MVSFDTDFQAAPKDIARDLHAVFLRKLFNFFPFRDTARHAEYGSLFIVVNSFIVCLFHILQYTPNL